MCERGSDNDDDDDDDDDDVVDIDISSITTEHVIVTKGYPACTDPCL
jgi:hypothetical protein